MTQSFSDKSVSFFRLCSFLYEDRWCSSFCLIPSPSFGSIPAAFSITTSAYIVISLLYASYTNLGLFVLFIKPGIVLLVNPTFKTVSIIPGIDCLAPERTERRRGLLLSPNFAFIIFSTAAIDSATSPSNPSGNALLLL